MIPGFEIIDYLGHKKHGIATYVKKQINQQLVKKLEWNEHTIGIRLGNITIFNVYKPPSSTWSSFVLPRCQHSGFYIGDFNARITEWGYSSEGEDGELLVNWSQINRTFLMYDAKEGGTFTLADGEQQHPQTYVSSQVMSQDNN